MNKKIIGIFIILMMAISSISIAQQNLNYNSNNSDDLEPVKLSTLKNKFVLPDFITLLQTFLENYPNLFPLLRLLLQNFNRASPDVECQNEGFYGGIAKFQCGETTPDEEGICEGYEINVVWGNDCENVSWTSNLYVCGVIEKAGNNPRVVHPGGYSGYIEKSYQQAISHITFCCCETETGCLNITKEVIIPPEVTGTIIDSFTIQVSGPSGTFTQVFNYDGSSVTPDPWQLCDLIPGVYTITETVAGTSYTWTVGGDTEATVVAGQTATATVTNTFVPGCLEVTKEVIIPPEVTETIIDSFTIQVSGPSGTFTQVFNYDGSSVTPDPWQLCDLIPGVYTITETVAGTSYTWTVGGDTEATVVAGQTATATVTNTFVPETGCLEVIKTWEDLGTGETYTDPIDVEIYDSTGAVVGTLTLTLGNSWTDQLCNLLPGTYTFQEVSPTGWTPTYNPTNRQLIVVAGTDPDPGAIGYITNTIDIGCLKVIKTWEDLGTGETYTDPIDVEIYDSTGAVVGTLTLTLGNSWTDQLCNLLPGTYTFQEVSPTGWTPTYNPTNRQLIVVAGTDPDPGAIGYITNTIDIGCLKVIKTWEDLGTGETYTDPIDVEIYDSTGAVVGTLTLTSGNSWTDQLCNLLPGTYTFQEVSPTGWTPTYNPTNRQLIVVAGTDPNPGAIGYITNTIDTGCLEVIKTWEDTGETYTDPIDVEIYDSTGAIVGTLTLTSGNSWTDQLCNLLPGTYTFQEVSPTGWTPTYNPTNRQLIVVAGTDPDPGAIGTIHNCIDLGKIRILKFDGSTGLPLCCATFRITPNPHTGTGYMDVTDNDGVYDQDPDDGEIEIHNVLFGTYLIEEIVPPPGYGLAPNVTIEVINSTTIPVARFDNYPLTGCLQVIKTWEDLGTGETYTDPIDVEIYDSTGAIVGTLTLTSGNSWTDQLCNLLPGTYTFQEVSPTGWTPTYNPTNRQLIVVDGTDPDPGAIGYITNTIDTGCLEVIKTWEDLGTGETYTDPIDVEIYDSTGAIVGTLTLTSGNSWTDQLCNLLPGTYTFQEVSPTGWTPTYNPTNRQLIVVAGTDPDPGAIGYITNTIDIGCLKVIKTWEDLGTGETYTDPIDVEIYDSTGAIVGTLTLTSGNSWTDQLCNLLPGTYTFQEVSPTGWTPTYNPTNRQLIVVAGTDPNPGAIGYITNTIDTGCLKVIKTWEDLGTGETYTDPIDVEIYDSTGAIVGTLTLTSGNSWTDQLCNLLPGTYTFQEVSPTGWTPTYNPTNRQLIVVAGTDPDPGAIGYITNTIDLGCLNITKNVTLGDLVYPTGYFDGMQFEICINGPSYPTGNCKTATYPNNLDLQWCNLLPGQYTITETDPGINWIVEITGSPAIVPAGGYAEAWVNNTFKPGCIIVTKVIEWGEVEPEPVSIEVCIQGPSYPYPTKLCHTFTAAGTHKFDNLIPGWYWVNETDPGLGWIVTNMTNYVEVLPGNITCTHVEIINIPEDPPETYKTLIGCLYYEDPYYYITSDTQICFYAFDDRSGVAFTYIEIWWDQNINGIEEPGETTNIIIYDNSPDDLDPAIGFIEYCMTIPDECYHQIRYYSVDNAGLIEDIQIELDLVDHTPPIIIKTHPDPCYYPTGPTSGIIKVGGRIILEAIDGGTPPCISGVEDIYYGFTYKGKWYPEDPFDEYCGNYNITKYIDDKWWYTYTMPIRFHEECKHILEYWTKDNICNTGPLHRRTYWVNKCQEEVWIDDNFGFDTPGWWHTHYRDKQMALDWLGPGGTAYVNDGVYHGDIIIDAVPCCNNTGITQKGEHGFPIGDSAIITGSETIKVNNVTIKYLEYMPNTNGSIIVVPGVTNTTLRCNKFRKDCVADAIGVKALGGSIVNARLNWWGAPDGPSGGVMDDGKIADGLGVKIFGEVFVEPWLGIHAEISKPEEDPLEVEVGTPVTFDATGSWAYTYGECCQEEIEKPLQYLWDFDDGKKSSNKIAIHIFDQPGTYVVTLMVDAPGIPGLYPNIMYDWAYTTIHVVSEQTPLTCSADGGSLEGYQTIVNEPLQLYGDAYGGKGEYNWYWNFGDQTADSTLQNPIHTYTKPGNYIVKLTVISDAETATDTTTAIVYDIDELFVNINDANTIAGTEIMFAASITGGTPPYSIEWDFGDGTTSEENNPTHIYNNPGEYTITITVTDDRQKTAIDTATITVEEKTNVEITEIKEVIGGLGIQAVIAAGENNCHWEITVEGNVLLGGENSGVINSNTQETVRLGFSVAIGNVDIKVKASGSEKRYTAFALGPLYLNLKET